MSGSSETSRTTAGIFLLILSLLVAISALAGSLYLTWGMNLKACPLCFYQRAFAMSLVAVLGMGLFTGAMRSFRITLLALPLATAGMGVALFHVYLELAGKLECPRGILEIGTAPKQSLAVFAVLFLLLLMDAINSKGWTIAGVILGALLAAASCTSNPPPAKPKPEDYQRPPEICRPVLQDNPAK